MITLTHEQIRDLAAFAGLTIQTPAEGWDELDNATEFVIASCPPEGVTNEGEPDDPDSVSHYEFVVYCAECPEEGCMGLGPEIAP